jgi:hypothetical protein
LPLNKKIRTTKTRCRFPKIKLITCFIFFFSQSLHRNPLWQCWMLKDIFQNYRLQKGFQFPWKLEHVMEQGRNTAQNRHMHINRSIFCPNFF